MKKIICIFLCILMIVPLLSITATANSPPNPPEITIPDKIKAGKWFKIQMVTIDPDGDDLFYRVDCPGLSNIWLGPFPSRLEYNIWVKLKIPTGVYSIGVQAKDIHDAESDWTYLEFNVAKYRAFNQSLFNLLQENQNLFSLLRLFLQRLDLQ